MAASTSLGAIAGSCRRAILFTAKAPCEADVDRAQQAEKANFLLARHRGPPVLLLPNVWDACSARLFAAAGFDALATTSGGVAWALGYPDGELAPWTEVVAATGHIVRSAHVPVSRRRRRHHHRRRPLHRSPPTRIRKKEIIDAGLKPQRRPVGSSGSL
jgi:hypothetical protein